MPKRSLDFTKFSEEKYLKNGCGRYEMTEDCIEKNRLHYFKVRILLESKIKMKIEIEKRTKNCLKLALPGNNLKDLLNTTLLLLKFFTVFAEFLKKPKIIFREISNDRQCIIYLMGHVCFGED